MTYFKLLDCAGFRLLFLFLDASVHIEYLPTFIFATNSANIVRHFGAAAIFAKTQNRSYQCMVASCIAPLTPRMSHSHYHCCILLQKESLCKVDKPSFFMSLRWFAVP